VHLHAYASGSEARSSLTRYFSFYNGQRVHESLGYATPDEVYSGALSATTRAAA
jgi:putative transposase